MTDLSQTIAPKTDQQNADDLLTGPRTIKITAVSVVAGDQPVHIRFEGDDGRPYKPGKSMRRVLVNIWGAQGAVYVGRRLTLYNDKSIRFGPDTTGGIRISHASDIPGPVEMALTVTRGKRKMFRVEPLAPEKTDSPPRPLDELMAAGDAIAPTGEEAYRNFWTKGLTAAERDLLGGANGKCHQAWKGMAAAKSAP